MIENEFFCDNFIQHTTSFIVDILHFMHQEKEEKYGSIELDEVGKSVLYILSTRSPARIYSQKI